MVLEIAAKFRWSVTAKNVCFPADGQKQQEQKHSLPETDVAGGVAQAFWGAVIGTRGFSCRSSYLVSSLRVLEFEKIHSFEA
jgi:hypothetical protein